jgi:hypothetical protein
MSTTKNISGIPAHTGPTSWNRYKKRFGLGLALLVIGIAIVSGAASAKTAAGSQEEVTITISITEGSTRLCHVEIGYDRISQRVILKDGGVITHEKFREICDASIATPPSNAS